MVGRADLQINGIGWIKPVDCFFYLGGLKSIPIE